MVNRAKQKLYIGRSLIYVSHTHGSMHNNVYRVYMASAFTGGNVVSVFGSRGLCRWIYGIVYRHVNNISVELVAVFKNVKYTYNTRRCLLSPPPPHSIENHLYRNQLWFTESPRWTHRWRCSYRFPNEHSLGCFFPSGKSNSRAFRVGNRFTKFSRSWFHFDYYGAFLLC